MKVMKKAALVGAAAIAATVGLTPAAHATSGCTYSDNGSYYYCATATWNRTNNFTTVTITQLNAPSTTDFRWTITINGHTDTGLVNSNSGSKTIDVFDGRGSFVLKLTESKYGPGSLGLSS